MRRRLPFLALLVPIAFALFAAPPTGADEAQALRDRLREIRVDLDVEEAAFFDVVDMLKVQAGVAIVVDPRVAYDLETAEITRLVLDDVSLATALNLLADALGEEVTWTVQDAVVVFTMREYLPRRLVSHVLSVMALTRGTMDYGALRPPLLAPPREEDFLEDEPLEEPRLSYGSVDNLIELIRAWVEPEFWEEVEGAGLQSFGEHALVAKATPEVQAEGAAFLAGLERRRASAVEIEVRAVASDAYGIASNADSARLAALLGPGAPSVTLLVRRGGHATACAGRRQARVAAEQVVLVGGASWTDPIVDALETGMAVHVEIPAQEDDGRLLVKLDVAVAESPAARGDDAGSLRRESLRRSATLLLEPGAWYALGTTAGKGPAPWALLVRAKPVETTVQSLREAAAVAVPAPAAPRRAETDPLIQRLATTRVQGLSFEEADLDEALGFLRTTTGVNFNVTRRLRWESFEDVVVDLDLDDVAATTVLDLLTEPYALAWWIEGGVVRVGMVEEAPGPLVLAMYDVGDLAAPVTLLDDPRMFPEILDEVPLFADRELLTDLVREHVGTWETWEDERFIDPGMGERDVLVVRNTAEVQDAVQELLRRLRRAQRRLVATLDLVQMGADQAEALLAQGALAPRDMDRMLATEIDRGTVRRIAQDRLVSTMGTGRVQRSGEEYTYVGDYDVLNLEGTSAVDAVLEEGFSGTVIALRLSPLFAYEGASADLVYDRAVRTDLHRRATPHGDLELPETEVFSVRTSLDVPYGRTAVLGTTGSGDRRLLLLLTLHEPAAD